MCYLEGEKKSIAENKRPTEIFDRSLFNYSSLKKKLKQNAQTEFKKYVYDKGKFPNVTRHRPYRLWGPSSLLYNGYLGSLPQVKRPGLGVNHSPLSSADVKNKWSYTSTAPTCPRGVHRDFTFTNTCDIH
jgi:hypothetical protein